MKIRHKINLWITLLGLLVNVVLVAVIVFEVIDLAYETLDEELEMAIQEDLKPLAGTQGEKMDHELFDRLLDFNPQYWIKVYDEEKNTVFASPLAQQIRIPFKDTDEAYNYDIRLPDIGSCGLARSGPKKMSRYRTWVKKMEPGSFSTARLL